MTKKNATATATANTASALSTLKVAKNEGVVSVVTSAFRLDMLIARDTDAKTRKEKRLSSDSAANMSELKLSALREEIKELEKALAGYKAELAKIEGIRSRVVSELVEAGNDKTAVENLFRVLACFGDKSLNKYALRGICTTWTPELEAAMDTAHSLKFSEKTGSPILGKKEKEAFRSAMNIIKESVRGVCAVAENPYFGKVSVNLNMTDIGELHKAYITGFGLDYKKDKKTGLVTLNSREYVEKTLVRKPRGKNTKIDASAFWGAAVNCIILHICR